MTGRRSGPGPALADSAWARGLSLSLSVDNDAAESKTKFWARWNTNLIWAARASAQKDLSRTRSSSLTCSQSYFACPSARPDSVTGRRSGPGPALADSAWARGLSLSLSVDNDAAESKTKFWARWNTNLIWAARASAQKDLSRTRSSSLTCQGHNLAEALARFLHSLP